MSREALARLEVGQTEIGRGLSVTLTLLFLFCVFAVPLAQLTMHMPKSNPLALFLDDWIFREDGDNMYEQVVATNKEVLRRIDYLETNLEEESFLRELFLPSLQYAYTRFLGQGNEKVVVGRDGWLFYRPGFDALTGQPFLSRERLELRKEGHEIWEQPVQPDPVFAITHFRNQLAERDIQLLIVPIPVKPSIHPEKISLREFGGELTNRSYHDFLKKLDREGILYFDARPVLLEYAEKHGAAFLATDTHWLPGAMQEVAGRLSNYIIDQGLVSGSSSLLRLHKVVQSGDGDIAKMLTLPPTSNLFTQQQVAIKQLLTEANEFWQPDREAEILLLGDSFTNIYSLPGLGWGESGGFAEHLSYNLQSPLDLMARNGSGAYATREMLSTEMHRGRDRLSGKKLVVWQFSERELALGDWKELDISLAESYETGFYTVAPGTQTEVTGTVAAISRSPRPGAVPYRDNIVTLHLVDLEGGDPTQSNQALVYGLGMSDNTLTPFAALRPNDSVRLTLYAWDDMETKYGSYRRSPLDDDMMELELPNWGEIRNGTVR